jgi:hypothetical protein
MPYKNKPKQRRNAESARNRGTANRGAAGGVMAPNPMGATPAPPMGNAPTPPPPMPNPGMLQGMMPAGPMPPPEMAQGGLGMGRRLPGFNPNIIKQQTLPPPMGGISNMPRPGMAPPMESTPDIESAPPIKPRMPMMKPSGGLGGFGMY